MSRRSKFEHLDDLVPPARTARRTPAHRFLALIDIGPGLPQAEHTFRAKDWPKAVAAALNLVSDIEVRLGCRPGAYRLAKLELLG